MRGRSALVAVGVLGAGGCGQLPAPLAPIPPVAYSVSELEDVARESVPLPFTDRAVLQTLRGDTVRGRDAILDYFTAPPGLGHHSIDITTGDVYRCGPETGMQNGIYRAVLENESGFDQIASGRWRADWVKSGEEWRIAEAAFLEPSRGPASVPPHCIGMAEDRYSTARFRLSVHPNPASYVDSNPHDFLDFEGAGEVAHVGFLDLLAGAHYRLWKGFGVGSYIGNTPTRVTPLGNVLQSKLRFGSVGVGYEGRNVALNAGPAWVQSEWWWTTGRLFERIRGKDATFSRPGAIVSLHVVIPLYRQLSLDLLAQQRYFGTDRGIPDLDPDRETSQDHLFMAVGVAITPGR